jgi:cell wall-associated NlpC family hydrolase
MSGRRKTIPRLIAAALLILPLVVGSFSVSSAAPSKEEVEAARAKLEELNRHLDLLIEQYNQARIKLEEARAQLDAAQRERAQAQSTADEAMKQLAKRAVAVFTGMGSQLDVLLGAESFTEFSDRLQFMNALAKSDADLAIEADAAGERARRAADRFAQAAAEHQDQLDQLAARQAEIESAISEQRALYEELNQDYKDALAAQRAAEQAAAEALSGTSSSGGGDWGGFVPPPNASASGVAVAAAYAVIGTQYVWGSADPSVGFDCSGLTSWAWAQAGVYLPHSSAEQYAVLPHITDTSQLAPGDLLFFYSPISHVSMYVGNGMHVDASYPGPGGEVKVEAVYWQYFVGAGRPG